jgi:hypothetical protein
MSKSVAKNTPKKASTPKKVVKTTKVVNTSGKEKLVYTVPECVTHYFDALVNPFDTPAGACLPCDLLPLPSQKAVGYSKGTMSTGTTGFGFITLAPAIVNDTAACTFTGPTSVGTAGAPFSTYTNLSTSNFPNLPYTGAPILAKTLKGRAVAYGIRIRCTASAMSRGGTYVTGEAEQHTGIAEFSYTSLSSNNRGRRHAIPVPWDAEAWESSVVSSGPCVLDELQYNYSYYGYTPALIPDALIIAISSAVPAMTFDFEAYIHVEYMGSTVGSLQTRSHASPVGFSSVIEASKDLTTTHGNIGTADSPSLWSKFKDYFLEEGPQLASIGMGALKMLSGDEGGGALQMLGGGVKLLQDSFSTNTMASIAHTPGMAHRSLQLPAHGPIIVDVD